MRRREFSRPIFQLAEARNVGQGGEEQGPRSGFGGQDFFWIALAGSIAAFVLLVFKPNRQRLREAEMEQTLLRAEISQLESRVTHLRAWEHSLTSGDRDAWSSLARERLGWLAPGETLIAGGRTRGDDPPREAPRGAAGVRTE